MSCKVCFNGEFETVIKRDDPQHLICKNCGFTFMKETKFLEQYYEKDYWESFHHVSKVFDLNSVQTPVRGIKIYSLLEKYLSQRSQCLEIGAGLGFTLNFIRKKSNCSVLGLEPSELGVANMKHNNIPAIKGTLEEFNSPNTFDVIILCHVFEHFADPRNALSLIKKLLSRNGVIYVEVPNLLNPELYKNLNHWFSKEHYFYYSLEKLNFFFTQAGFRSIYSEESNVIKCMYIEGDDKKPTYTNEFSKVKRRLILHKILYYPARVVRVILKKLKLDD